MKFIPCNTDAWEQAEKKAKRKVTPKGNPAPSKRRDAKLSKSHAR